MLILTASEFETKISANFFQNPKVWEDTQTKRKKKNPRHEKTSGLFFIALKYFQLILNIWKPETARR